MENCPDETLFPAKGCPAYRSSPVDDSSMGRNCMTPMTGPNCYPLHVSLRHLQSLARPSLCKTELLSISISMIPSMDGNATSALNGLQENFDKRDKKKAQITFPLRHFFPLKVVK
jgi:hypothetical protein